MRMERRVQRICEAEILFSGKSVLRARCEPGPGLRRNGPDSRVGKIDVNHLYQIFGVRVLFNEQSCGKRVGTQMKFAQYKLVVAPSDCVQTRRGNHDVRTV